MTGPSCPWFRTPGTWHVDLDPDTFRSRAGILTPYGRPPALGGEGKISTNPDAKAVASVRKKRRHLRDYRSLDDPWEI